MSDIGSSNSLNGRLPTSLNVNTNPSIKTTTLNVNNSSVGTIYPNNRKAPPTVSTGHLPFGNLVTSSFGNILSSKFQQSNTNLNTHQNGSINNILNNTSNTDTLNKPKVKELQTNDVYTQFDSSKSSNTNQNLDVNNDESTVCRLWVHDDRFSRQQLVINRTFFPSLQVGDLVEIYPTRSFDNKDMKFDQGLEENHDPNEINSESGTLGYIHGLAYIETGKKRANIDSVLIMQVTNIDKDLIQKQPKLQISIAQEIASSFGLRSRIDVTVKKVDKQSVSADFLELSFRDQYVGRNDMWRIKLNLQGTAISKGRKLNILGTRLKVETVYVNGHTMSSGFITESTKIIFRSASAKYFIFIQLCKEMWEFDEDGELNFEKCLNGYLPEVFAKWRENSSNHIVSIVLFTRIFYPSYDPKKEVGTKIELPGSTQKTSNLNVNDKTINLENQDDHLNISMDSELSIDSQGRYYRDYYKVVIDWETSKDWNFVIPVLNKEFTVFKRDSLQSLSIKGQSLLSGVIASSPDGNILEAVNLALNPFDKHYIDRDLTHTGLSILIVTPGSGIFEVDKYLCRLTAHRMIDNGISLDVICLSRPPLYTVPLLQYYSKYYKDKSGPKEFDSKSISGSSAGLVNNKLNNTSIEIKAENWDPLYYDDHNRENIPSTFQCIPNWMDCHFWTRDKSIEGFPLRCKMFEVQMMGLMEEVGNSIMVPSLEPPSLNYHGNKLHKYTIIANSIDNKQQNVHGIGHSNSRGVRFDFGSEDDSGTTGAEDDTFPCEIYDELVFDDSPESFLLQKYSQSSDNVGSRPYNDNDTFSKLNRKNSSKFSISNSNKSGEIDKTLSVNFPPSPDNSILQHGRPSSSALYQALSNGRLGNQQSQAQLQLSQTSHHPSNLNLVHPHGTSDSRQFDSNLPTLSVAGSLYIHPWEIHGNAEENQIKQINLAKNTIKEVLSKKYGITSSQQLAKDHKRDSVANLNSRPLMHGIRNEGEKTPTVLSTTSVDLPHISVDISKDDSFSSPLQSISKAGTSASLSTSPIIPINISKKHPNIGFSRPESYDKSKNNSLEPPSSYPNSFTESFKRNSPSIYDAIKHKGSPVKNSNRTLPGNHESVLYNNINPCNPTKNVIKATSDIRRWQHVLPLTYNPLRNEIWMNWRSLCFPASLPLTTDYFPSAEELSEFYQEYTYNVSPADDFATAITARIAPGDTTKGLNILLKLATANAMVSNLAINNVARQFGVHDESTPGDLPSFNSDDAQLTNRYNKWRDSGKPLDPLSIISAPVTSSNLPSDSISARFSGTSLSYAVTEIGKAYLLLMELVGQRLSQGFQLIVGNHDISMNSSELTDIQPQSLSVSKIPNEDRGLHVTINGRRNKSKLSNVVDVQSPSLLSPAVGIRSGAFVNGPSLLDRITTRDAPRIKRDFDADNDHSNSNNIFSGFSSNNSDIDFDFTTHEAVTKLLREASVPFYLSMGDHVHKLSYDASGNNIEVKRYVKKLTFSTAPVEYSFMVSPKDNSQFLPKTLSFYYPQLSRYNWNYLDHHVSGYQDEMTESLHFWRTRLVLIPAETVNTKSSFLNPKGDDLDEEEVRLVGFEKFIETVERMRWEDPVNLDSNISTSISKKRKGVRTLTIIPTTLNLSRFVKEEVCDINSNLRNNSTFVYSDFTTGNIRKKTTSGSSMDEIPLSKNASANIFLTRLMQDSPIGLTIKDRKWHFKLYEKVFLGNEFVDWVVHNVNDIDTREEALELGNKYLIQGFFEHVLSKHSFLDGHYFYRIRDEFYEKYSKASNILNSQFAEEPLSYEVKELKRSANSTNPAIDTTRKTGTNDSFKFTGFFGSNTNNLQKEYQTNVPFALTKSIMLDLDPHKRSRRLENAVLHYDTVHNPRVCYHLQLHWLVCSSHAIEELLLSWSRTAEKCGLKLVEAGVGQANELSDDNPFQSLKRIKFCKLPNIDKLNEELESKLNFKIDFVFYQFEILNKLGFFLDVETRSNIPTGVVSTSCERAQEFKRTQWIYKTGISFIQLDGDDFLWVPNRLHLTGFASLNSSVHNNSTEYSNHLSQLNDNVDSSVSPNITDNNLNINSNINDVQSPTGEQDVSQVNYYSELKNLKNKIIQFCTSESQLDAFYSQVEKSLRNLVDNGGAEWASPTLQENDLDTSNIIIERQE